METLEPLGDQAALASFADEQSAWRFATAARRLNAPWLVDVVQAYTTTAVFYDLGRTNFAAVADVLRSLNVSASPTPESRLHQIPCCYELGLDWERVHSATGLSMDQVVRLHARTEYTVYAIGFSPGFPYLGYLPKKLCGVPRLPSPRVRVDAGSVGLTGRQTGIYPEERPGGWNLIGRTPLQIVDPTAGYFPLRTGDRVRFVPIDATAFRELLGRRL
jgi:inhibitor of KinA